MQRTRTKETTVDEPEPPLADGEQLAECPQLIPSDKTPQEFYAEMMQRPDVRAILEELAKG